MDFRLLGLVMICVCSASIALAQTIYNAPGQSGTAQPLNLREMMRQEQAARQQQQMQRQSNIPYVTTPTVTQGMSFEQRRAALNGWRDERDAQAWRDSYRTRDHMVALADASDATTFGNERLQARTGTVPGQPSATTPQQPARPMIYRGARDQDTIQTPRRLFNTPD